MFDRLRRSQGGRPTFIADIPYEVDRALPYYEKFFAVATKLNYREIMAISRLYNMHYTTIYKWKYRRTIPKWPIILDIIEWGKQGKPLKKIPAAPRDMFNRGML